MYMFMYTSTWVTNINFYLTNKNNGMHSLYFEIIVPLH